MPERRPLAIFGRYVQILPGADITAVQEALGFFLGPYFPHNAWLLCRSALHEMTASWTPRARWPRIRVMQQVAKYLPSWLSWIHRQMHVCI